MDPPTTGREYRELLIRICHDKASSEEVAWLSAALRRDLRLRYIYLEFMATEGAIHEHVSTSVHPSAQPFPVLINWGQVFEGGPPCERRSLPGRAAKAPKAPFGVAQAIDWRKHPVRFLTVTAIITALLWVSWGGFFLAGREKTHIANQTRPPSAEPLLVAQLLRSVDAVWSQSGRTLLPGEFVAAGELLHLENGYVEVQFKQGASVLLEGPTEFKVVAPNSGALYAGRLCAKIPVSAVGFTVETPVARIVDRGTEFGLDARESGQLNVQVFQGAVEVSWPIDGPSPGVATTRRLERGESLRISQGGLLASAEHPQTPFVRTLPLRAESAEEEYQQEVSAAHPVAYWTLQGIDRAVVADQLGRHPARWFGGVPTRSTSQPGTRFDGYGHYFAAPFQPTLQTPSFSAEAWVLIARDTGDFQSLFSSRENEPHALRRGFALYANPRREWEIFLGDGLPNSGWKQLAGGEVKYGRWMHVVVQFEHQGATPSEPAGTARLYIDGVRVLEAATSYTSNTYQVVRVGAGSLPQAKPAYFLAGQIAHVALYDRALTAETIRRHFEIGGKRFLSHRAD